MIIRTLEFQLSRSRIAMTAAKVYLGTFWWLLIGVPLAGLLAILFIDVPMVKYIGGVCLLWPFTIPARAGIITSKLGRQLLKRTIVEINEEAIVFESAEGDGARMGLRWTSIRKVRLMSDHYVILTRRYGFTLFPSSSFATDEDRATFERVVAERVGRAAA